MRIKCKSCNIRWSKENQIVCDVCHILGDKPESL
jgi:hypothetical protein